MNHTCLTVGTIQGSSGTSFIVIKLYESACHDPVTKHQTKANTRTQQDKLASTNKIHMEALTSGSNISADRRFPIDQNLFLLTTHTEEMTTKQDEKHCAVACTISWVAWLMELAQHVCHVMEGLRDTGVQLGFGKKAGEIKRNDVAHLLHLYSISSPQTAGPGCTDERLSGGQERRS